MRQVPAADLFNRIVDELGADLAADVMRQATDYANTHTGCRIVHVAIEDQAGAGVEIRIVHQAGCPAATEQENP